MNLSINYFNKNTNNILKKIFIFLSFQENIYKPKVYIFMILFDAESSLRAQPHTIIFFIR